MFLKQIYLNWFPDSLCKKIGNLSFKCTYLTSVYITQEMSEYIWVYIWQSNHRQCTTCFWDHRASGNSANLSPFSCLETFTSVDGKQKGRKDIAQFPIRIIISWSLGNSLSSIRCLNELLELRSAKDG